MKRDEIIKKVVLTLETMSDRQLEYFVANLKKVIKEEKFRELSEPTPFLGWGRDTSSYEQGSYNWRSDNN